MTPATRFSRRTAMALFGSAAFAGAAAINLAPRALAQTAPTFTAGSSAIVTAAQLNVRSTPSLSAPIVTTLVFNTQVYLATGPVSADGYTWFRLQSERGAGSGDFLGWAVTAFLGPITTTPPVEGGFANGATVTVTASLLNVRANPTTSAAVLATYAFGRTATITGGPTVADGITWYAVDNVGWVAGQYLEAGGTTTPPPTSGAFPVGTVVAVNVPSLNVRAAAGTSFAVNATLTQGTQLTIAEGPVAANGYSWYRVTGAAAGWVAGELVVRSGGTTPPPSGGIAVGSTVTVTAQQVNVRSGAGTSFSVTATARAGDTFTVYEGPVAANGYSWYRVSNLVGAWIASDFIAVSGGSTPPPTSGGFTYGQRVSVTAGTLNVRSNPTTSASVIATYSYGRAATITGGPTVANGITWYAVDNLGWVSGQYLTA